MDPSSNRPVTDKAIADQIAQLYALRQSGALSNTEFENAKRRLLGEAPPRLVAQPPPTLPSSHSPARVRRPTRWIPIALVFAGIVAALFILVAVLVDPDDGDDVVPSEAYVPKTINLENASISMGVDGSEAEDTTEYMDGNFGVIVTITNSAHWEQEGTGCTGATDGPASDIRSGQLASVSPVGALSSTNVAFLPAGVMFDDGSCQFAFEAKMFEADAYDITIWQDSAICDRSEVVEVEDGLIAEVIVDATGLHCKPFVP